MSSQRFISSLTRRGFAAGAVRAALGLVAANALPMAARAQSSLPSLGDGGDLSAAQERRLGDLIAADLYRDPDYVDDPILGEYVDGIWRRLIAAAKTRGDISPDLEDSFAWRMVLGRDSEINAFALPGGYMGVLMGMIGVIETRDELASVLGHETGHIVQRHIARMITGQKRQTPLMIAALLLGAVAASQNPQAGAALAAGGQAALIRQQLVFSRDMEREADRIGYGLMTQAGFRPQGFVTMFQKLEAASRLNDNGDWPFLRSHPLTTERIADMQLREQSLPPTPTPPPDWETLLLAARARTASRPGVDVLRQWSGEPASGGFGDLPLVRRAPALYAAALAQAELRNPGAAQRLAAQLAASVKDHERAAHHAALLQAELALRAGDAAAALRFLPAPTAANQNTTARDQTGRAVLMLRADALKQSGRAADAVALLQSWVGVHTLDADAWTLLGGALQDNGQQLRALRAAGEARMAELDYGGAVDRFRAAQDYSRQHANDAAGLIDATIVDARLGVARDALRQQKEAEEKWS